MLPVPAIALMLTNFFLHGPAPEFYSNPNPVIEVAQLCDDNTGVCQYVDKQFVVAKEETRKQLQHEEAARLKAAQEKAEQERIALQKAEQERVAAERAEQERLAREKAEQERVAKEQAEQERIALENAEQQRLANEKAEQERVAAEKAEQERVAAEKAEQERLAAEKAAEEQRIAAEEQRIAAEKAAEEQRIAAEKAAEEKKAKEAAAAAKPKEAEKKKPAAEKEAASAKEAATPEPKSKEPEEYGGEFKWTKEQKNALDKHNELRTKHGAAFLNLSKGLSVMATKWAKHLASIDKMEHTTLEQRQNTGESLYVEFGRDVNSGEGERATQWWYDEIKDYDYSKPVFDWATGHFTQLVWFGTVDMGLGVAVSETGKTYVVANYFPPGNTAGQFEANVGKALNKK